MVEILQEQSQPRNLEMPVHDLPIETPDRAIPLVSAPRGARREKCGNERRVGPVEKPRRHSMMLRRDEELPVVVRARIVEMRTRVADEVPEDVLLEIDFGVRRFDPTEFVQGGE